MMRALVLALTSAIVAHSASSQTLRVQSGDHSGFTRLVLSIGADREWDIVQSDPRTYLLTVDPAVDAFDTSAAFDLIQRNRLAALTSAGGSLTLSLACPCQITGFRHQEEYLVLDIADPDPATVQAETEADATQTEPEFEDEVAASDDRQRAAEALPQLADLLRAPTELPDFNNTPFVPSEVEQATPDEGLTTSVPTQNPSLEEAAEIMAEQLARAAASGLLEASLGQSQSFADPVSTGAPETVAPDTHAEEAHESSHETTADHHETRTPHPSADELPVRTHTALDPAVSFDTPLAVADVPGACRAEPFDAREWAETESFEQGLGERRLALFDERDAMTQDGAEALARYYLYYGFGAEAQHWLLQMDEPPQDFLNIAELVDGSETADFVQVTSTADCSPGELLWRYVAGAVEVDLNSDDIAAIQRAFSELPAHLRDLLGPRLARRLHSERHGPAARNVREILHRGGRVAAAELQFLDLDLGISLASTEEETRTALSDMLTNGGANAVETMAQALAFDRSAGVLPTMERLTAAQALLRETGDGPRSALLWQETLLGYAALGAPDTALSMLSDPARAGSAREAALTELIAERVAVEDTAGLLILAYTFGSEWRPEGSDAGRAQVAAIGLLRDEGLYEAAQILRDVRRPLILPIREDDELGLPDPVTEAWESADWSNLAELTEGPHADVATRMAARSSEAGPPDTIQQDLAALDATVADSQSLREAIAALLNDPNPQ
ncbi:hypothetical protein [Gymnodinialimonas ulvae]|uniref:hypothetical protein n=1 Tax=Gymnodinialimonas ulvae TaxID=3126504 RepID=UPI0030ABFF0C